MIEILIADDNATLAQQLSNTLTKEKDFNILKISKNGKEAIEDYLSLNPDVLILDLDMPTMNGFEVIEYLSKLPSVSNKDDIIVLSSYDYLRYKISNTKKVKYILKRCNENNKLLLELIREIKEDQKYKPSFKDDLNNLFTSLNMKPYNKGTKYLKSAIEIIYYHNDEDINVSNIIQEIALHHNIKNTNTIQSNIDKTVYSIYKKYSSKEVLQNIFSTTYQLSTKEFISRVICYIDKN